jgi:arginyl-tRNA synthetase
VVLELEKRLSDRLRAVLKEKYDLEISSIPLETPPDLRLGEIATPIAFELARKLRKAPKIIAQEIVTAIASLPGFSKFEVAGAGYINAFLDRAAAAQLVAPAGAHLPSHQGHVLVEHTSINPNKAAHIGHLRNAILGDTFVRLLRAAGYKVDVQNYIDNTGVQVADVVVGLFYLRNLRSASQVRAWIEELEKSGRRIDFECWDIYAEVSKKYQEENEPPINQNPVWQMIRRDYLHKIEEGSNDEAEIADLISTAVLRRHLETMLRLAIEYDFLPRESEILHLKFWEAAFEKLKKSGVLYFENEGKNKGCWVMTRPGAPTEPLQNEDGTKYTDDDAKVIVRSNGTVTYVGKDIAYHLWKFGLLGKDFGYKRFFTYPDHECWISAESGEPNHPHFGGATAIYNVIDARQSDPQANVIQALRGMGYTEQADHYTHFSYEMVALTPRCAVELGYNISDEDQKKSYIEVSGRKGFGVKADDLIDKLIAATRAEVDSRQTGGEGESAVTMRQKIAEQIAIGALRYFMLKVTRNSVIAFDFKDALSFEGETGPYIQYAVVRIRNIFRKGNTAPEAVLADFANLPASSLGSYFSGGENQDIWSLWLRAGRRTQILQQCIATSEPTHLARHAFQLAQEFANFYHRHHILTEEDPARKTFLLATAAIALRELVGSLALLGIESPEAM